jgi:hypothetical protein
VTNFYGYTKLQEFNVLLKEEKRKLIETDKAHIQKLRDALEKFKKLSIDEYETVDEKMDDIFERDSIFSFPRSWKKGKKHIEDSAVGLIEEPVAKAKQPYRYDNFKLY